MREHLLVCNMNDMNTKLDTREALIESMRDLLWERGYVGTSPKAVLDRSGVGQGSMYHHFSGKAELAKAAIQRSAESLQALAEERLAVPGTAIDKIASFLQRDRNVLRGCQVGRLTQDPEVIKNEMLRQPLADAFENIRGQLVVVLAQGVARQELHEDLDVNGTAEVILSSLQGGYVLSRAVNSDAPFRKTIGGLLSILHSAQIAGYADEA